MRQRIQWVLACLTVVVAATVILRAQLWVSSGSGISTSGTVSVTNAGASALSVTGGADIGGVIQAGSGNVNLTNSTGNLLEAAIADGTVYPRNAGGETITGAWNFTGLTIFADNTFGNAVLIRGRSSDNIADINFRSNDAVTTYGRIRSTSTGGGTLDLQGTGAVTFGANVPVSNAGRYNSATAQPGFLAFNSSNDAGITGPSTVDFDSEEYDTTNNFTADTFTAPVAGKYLLCTSVQILPTAANDQWGLQIATSGGNYRVSITVVAAVGTLGGCTIADMAASDTASVVLTRVSGSSTATVVGQAAGLFETYFSGRLVP